MVVTSTSPLPPFPAVPPSTPRVAAEPSAHVFHTGKTEVQDLWDILFGNHDICGLQFWRFKSWINGLILGGFVAGRYRYGQRTSFTSENGSVPATSGRVVYAGPFLI